ncbi:MAG: 50S ribosomal protein L18 [Tenuifilum sp.]|uniref:50S ribosomal protein L18 n=1 Tax=Tenuifilum sp. TaxID=2760880 RepID=UPI000A7AA04D|nr:50S ribosomal protein L18 [Bacteroidales bacterium]HOK61006.1 50S ribosomal protein L18 [Tenuifilum sp.]MBP9028759.1 50S ribosomal protein L18 [Bacteroidales bacterium]HOK85668.1 50S ribosomal protein L18 [Tenuifilum sp.]HON70386.1 50S ribosomal protein L18 [Tenuifilum sp.]
MALNKLERKLRIRRRIRKRVSGTAQKPRMSVFRSNTNIYVQFIDDINGVTLASASSMSKEIAEKKNITKTEQARLVGQLAAKNAMAKGIESVVFDRGGNLYHGRVKALADAAREGGLKF